MWPCMTILVIHAWSWLCKNSTKMFEVVLGSHCIRVSVFESWLCNLSYLYITLIKLFYLLKTGFTICRYCGYLMWNISRRTVEILVRQIMCVHIGLLLSFYRCKLCHLVPKGIGWSHKNGLELPMSWRYLLPSILLPYYCRMLSFWKLLPHSNSIHSSWEWWLVSIICISISNHNWLI